MKKNKYLAVVLSIVICFAAFPFASLTTFAETEGQFRYSVSNGAATITGTSSSSMHIPSGAVSIPSRIGGYPVTTIGRRAFNYKTQITSVVIPSSVTTIKPYAFESCSLSSVTIPSSVTSIENSAFKGCSLTSVTIPSSITKIIDSTFYQCREMSYVVLPSSVTLIESFAFYGCSGLKDVYYTGTEQQKSRMTIESPDSYNKPLVNATWHYNCNPSNPTCTHSRTSIKNAVSATCTSSGYTGDTYCYYCGMKLSTGRSTSALGHLYSSAITPSTCTQKGYTTYTCSRCSYSYNTKYTDELGHNYITTVLSPTCTEGGYTTHICSRCSDHYESDHSEALGHIFGETGDERFICDRCGFEDSEKKAAAVQEDIEAFKNYKNELLSVADTLAQENDSEECTELIACAKQTIQLLDYDESKTFLDNQENAKRLIVQLEKALRLQRLSESYILGDADGNGMITIIDATIIQRYMASLIISNPEFVEICGDVDGDGEVSIIDATIIQRYLADYDTDTNVGKCIMSQQ